MCIIGGSSCASYLSDFEGALASSKRCAVLSFVELAQVDLSVGHGGPEAQRVGVERVVPARVRASRASDGGGQASMGFC